MPMIPNFPADLLQEHGRWHHERHPMQLNPPPGYGLEFLQFHRGFIRRALDWYRRSSGMDARLVEAWPSVPEAIRQAPCYSVSAEARIVRQPESFASADDLGRFIESSGLHGCIHETLAALHNDPELRDFDLAPRHTEFYQLHGMIDRWYQNWEGLGRFREGFSHWCGRFEKDEDEVLFYRRQDGTWWLGRLEAQPDIQGLNQLLEWSAAGDSRAFGPLDDGRPFRIWDTDGDGRREIVFYDPNSGQWLEGKLSEGRIRWTVSRTMSTQ